MTAALALIRRARWGARLSGLAAAGAGTVLGGQPGLLGAALGWLVVELNLGLLLLAVGRAPSWPSQGLRPLLSRFYLAFGATALVCFLVIRQHWGHPLAFLLGLLSFFLGLVLALISGGWKNKGAPRA